MNYSESKCHYYKILAFAILLVGFILGLIFGLIFPAITDDYVEVFNFILMLSTWVSSFILSVFILGIYSICFRLDAIAGNTDKGKKSRASENTSIHEKKYEEHEEKDEEHEENKKFIWE